MDRVFLIVIMTLALVGGSEAIYHEFAPPPGGVLQGGTIFYVLNYT